MGEKRAFTLVEVIVSILILALIGIGSYFSFSILSQVELDSQERFTAMNILTNYFERIRAVVREGGDRVFSTLETEPWIQNNQWIPVGSTGLTPNYLPSQYPSNFFTRMISVSTAGTTTELKRIEIAVQWPRRRGEGFNEVRNVFFLARPQPPLPGNIKGSVKDRNTEAFINNAEITLIFQDPGGVRAVIYSRSSPDADGCNFDFSDPDTGAFRLSPGNWQIIVTAQGYQDYNPSPAHIVWVPEGEEVILPPIYLDPKPAPAHIKGRIVDPQDKPLYQYVSLYEKGSYVARDHMWWHSPRSFNFKIDFEDPQPRCFTLVTSSTSSSWSYPYRYNQHCGDFCDPQGWGKSYNYRGWSSAVVREDGSVVCDNPWFGSAITDRLCVNPGDNLDLGDIVLVEVPLATISGYVRDSTDAPLSGAKIYIRWHDNARWYPYPAGSTDNNGYYQVSVPAAQELFPDTSNYYIRMTAGRRMPKQTCCNQGGTAWRESGWVSVGPLFQGDSLQQDFIIPYPPDDQCGDVQGHVKDEKENFYLEGVRVEIGGRESSSNDLGYYKIECLPEEEGCSIPIGSHGVRAEKSGYYTFESDGDWPYKDRPEVNIQQNEVATYETIRLYPRGYGTIKGRVLDVANDEPIEGAEVWLDVYNDNVGNKYDSLTQWHYNYVTNTDGEGDFVFSHVIETWPPEGIDDTYYQTNERKHLIAVTHTEEYEPVILEPFTLKANQELDLGDIHLTKKGQM